MATFAEQANSGFDPNTDGDWWNAIQRGGYKALADFQGLREMAGTAIGSEGTRLAGLAGRHAMEQAAQEEYEDISSPGRFELDSEFGESDNFWGQLAMKGLGMVAPAAATIGTGAIATMAGGPIGGSIAATLMGMGLNSGDAAQAVLSAIDTTSDAELLTDAGIFNQLRSGVPMEKIRADLKLDLGARAAAPTAIASAITGPLSAETGLGMFLGRFVPRVGASFLGSKAKGAALGAIGETAGEVLEEGTSAYGVNLAHERLPNVIPEQDAGRAMREAAILGSITGAGTGALITGRTRPPTEVGGGIDELLEEGAGGITVVPEGGLDPAIAAATRTATGPTPETVDLRPVMNEGTLTTGERPGVMVGVRPPNVPSNVTLEDAPFEQAEEFLAQYGYTPEDLTGMDPVLRAELDERFNETYIPDRMATSQQRVNDLDPAVHAAIVAANIPGGPPVSPGAAAQPPNVTPGGAAVAGEEGIQTTRAEVAPDIFLPDRYPRARDAAAEEGIATDTAPSDIKVSTLFEPLPPSEEARNLALTRDYTAGPMALRASPTIHNLQLERDRQLQEQRAIEAQQTDAQQRLIAEEKAAGTYESGMANRSKEEQAKRDDDEDRAHTIFANAGEIPADVDGAKQHLLSILDAAAETNLKVPLIVRKNMTNHMMWLANVRKTLKKLDADPNDAALPTLIANTAEARNDNWEPMRSKHVRQRSADVQLNEQLVGQGVVREVEDETLGEQPDEVTEQGSDEPVGSVAEVLEADIEGDADVGASPAPSSRLARPTFRRYTLDKSARERRFGRRIKSPSAEEAQAAGTSIQRWVEKRKSAAAPKPIRKDKIVSEADKADALDARARSDPDASAGETVTRRLTPKQEVEARAARLADEGREAEIPKVALAIAERVQRHAANLRADRKAAKAASKRRGARQSVMEAIVRKTGIKKRADTLGKEIRRELNTTPKDERNALYRAGLKEAQAAIKTARESLDDQKAANAAIRRAEHILASTKPEYKGYREFGAKPGRKALVTSTKPELRVIEGGGRRRLRNRRGQQIEPTLVAAPEDLTQRTGYREDTEGLVVSRKPLPVAGAKSVYGNPSKLFRTRSKGMFANLQKAWAAAQMQEYGRTYSFLEDIEDDVSDLIKQGDNSETMQRLLAMLKVAIRDPTTANTLKSMVRITTVMRKIDPSAEIAPSVEEQVEAMDEAFRTKALREFPPDFTPPKQAPFKPKTPYKPKRRYGRILPDLSKSEEQLSLLPIEHVQSRPPERGAIPALPKRVEMAEVVQKPFTTKERALLKEYGYTDTQISNPKVLGEGARARLRALVDELAILNVEPDTVTAANVTSDVTLDPRTWEGEVDLLEKSGLSPKAILAMSDEEHDQAVAALRKSNVTIRPSLTEIDPNNGVPTVQGKRLIQRRMNLAAAIRSVTSGGRTWGYKASVNHLTQQIYDEAMRRIPGLKVQILYDEEMDILFPAPEGKRNRAVYVVYDQQHGKGMIYMRDSVWDNETLRPNVLAHEISHALTNKGLEENPALDAAMFKLLEEIRGQWRSGFPHNGLRDIHELMAELSDYNFAKNLRQIHISSELKAELGLESWKPYNGWDAVLKIIASVLESLGLRIPDISALDALVSQFQIATELTENIPLDTGNIELVQNVSPYEGSSIPTPNLYFYSLTENDSELAEIQIHAPEGAQSTHLTVEWMGTAGGYNVLGPSVIRRLVKLLKQEYPNVEKITAERIGGARSIAGTTGNVTIRPMEVDRDMERETGVEMARNAMMNSTGIVDRTVMKLRTNDSLMRAAEEYYPGLARKYHNLVMERFTRGQELLNEDVQVQLERHNLYDKYADKKVGKETVKEFYENLLFDAGDHNIDPTVSFADNTWHFYTDEDGTVKEKAGIGKLHYPRLRADYERLAKAAPDLARYMRKEWDFTARKQRHIIDVTLTNIVRAFASDKDLTDAQALAIGQRIRDDEATDADKALFTESMLKDIRNAPELKERPGVYTPQLRYGDWLVNARVNVAKPTFKNAEHQPDLDGVVYDFHGAGAEEAANKYAAYYADGKTLRDEYSNVSVIWTKGGKERKPDGTHYMAKDAKDGAEQRFRVHVQDRHTEFFERESDARDASDKLSKDKYYKEVKGYSRKMQQLHSNQAAVSSRQLESILDQMKKHGTLAGMPKDVAASYMRALQEAARAIAPGTNINKRRMQRRHVAGASKDAARSMHSYSVQTANYIAAMELAPKLDRAEKDLREAIRNDYRAGSRGASLANEMIERRNAMNGLRNDSAPFVNAVTTLVFLDKLVSVAYSVINQMQLYTNTMPRIASKYPKAKVNRAIHRAMADIHYGKVLSRGFKDTGLAMAKRLEQSTDLVDYIIKGGKVNADERTMLQEMVKRGTLSADAGFEVSPLANKARTKAGRVVTGSMQYVENIGRQMPRAIDAGTRAISLLATYRLARENGSSHEDAMNIAQDITDETQFNYSPVNSPPVYNKGWGRVALQFTRYPAAMYQFMFSHAARALKGENKAESARALLLTMAMYTLFSGILGGGPWEPIRGAVILLNGMGLIDWDWSHVENAVREIAADMVGPTLGEAVTRGLPRMVGLDTSGRVTMSQLFLAQPQGDIQDANGLYQYAAGYLLGPSGGFLKDWPAGIEDLNNGRYLSAFAKLFPVKTVSDALKGLEGYTSGKRTRAGDVITEYNIGEALIQTMGFTPASSAEASERRTAVYSEQAYVQKKRSDLLQSFWETPKAERVRPAFVRQYRAAFDAFNQGLPKENWLSFQKARDYSKDKDRRFSKSSNAIPKDRSTDYLLERTSGVYNTR